MKNAIGYDYSLEIIQKFYEDCLEHWENRKATLRELPQSQLEVITDAELIIASSKETLALRDVEALRHDPFVPNGRKLNEAAKSSFINALENKLKREDISPTDISCFSEKESEASQNDENLQNTGITMT